jgi:hypothetical protein
MSELEMLEEALKILREDGWIKNAFESEKGHCIFGAIAEAARNECSARISVRCCSSIQETIIEQYPYFTEGVILFNDAPSITFEDVEKVLEKTIVKLREKI